LCIVFILESYFVDEAFVRDGKPVVFQITDFADGRVLVVCRVARNLDALKRLVFQVVADDAFEVSADKQVSVVRVYVLDVFCPDAPFTAVDVAALSRACVVGYHPVVLVGQEEDVVVCEEHLVQLFVREEDFMFRYNHLAVGLHIHDVKPVGRDCV